MTLVIPWLFSSATIWLTFVVLRRYLGLLDRLPLNVSASEWISSSSSSSNYFGGYFLQHTNNIFLRKSATAGLLISRRSLSQLLSCRVNWSYLWGRRQRKQAVKLSEIRKDRGSPLNLWHTHLAELHISFSPNFMSTGWKRNQISVNESIIFSPFFFHLSSCFLVLSIPLSSYFSYSFSLANPFFHPLFTSSLLVSVSLFYSFSFCSQK